MRLLLDGASLRVYWLAGPLVLATPIRGDGTIDLQDSDTEIVDSETPEWSRIYDALTVVVDEEEVEEALISNAEEGGS